MSATKLQLAGIVKAEGDRISEATAVLELIDARLADLNGDQGGAEVAGVAATLRDAVNTVHRLLRETQERLDTAGGAS